MDKHNLKRILAGFSIIGLLSGIGLVTKGSASGWSGWSGKTGAGRTETKPVQSGIEELQSHQGGTDEMQSDQAEEEEDNAAAEEEQNNDPSSSTDVEK